MQCEICKSAEATVHLTQIINGKMQKVELCENCAKEKGVSDPTGFSLADMLLGLGAADQMKSGTPDEIVCPACGFTQPDFKKTGRLGCPLCYTTFGEGLQAILKDMHKGTVHKGKVPSKIAAAQAYQHRLEDLKTELQKAVRDEKYERAASLRDEIVQIESHIKV